LPASGNGGQPLASASIASVANRAPGWSIASLPGGEQKVSEFTRDAAKAELHLLLIRKVRARLFETLYFAGTAAPDGMTNLNDKLAKLERYERRAFSMRKRALRAM
jgi:hypothetical protein